MTPIDYLRGVWRQDPRALPPASTPARSEPIVFLEPRQVAVSCPCIAIYTSCYCHLRKRTAP